MSSSRSLADVSLDLALVEAADTIRRLMWLVHDVAPHAEGKAKTIALEGYAALAAVKSGIKAKSAELSRAQDDVRKAVAILG